MSCSLVERVNRSRLKCFTAASMKEPNFAVSPSPSDNSIVPTPPYTLYLAPSWAQAAYIGSENPDDSELPFHALSDRGWRRARDPVACEFRSTPQRQHILSAAARDKGDWCDDEEEDRSHDQRAHDAVQ
jgi:hypothetical protein